MSNSTTVFGPDDFGGRTGTLSTQLLPSQTNRADITSVLFLVSGGTFSLGGGTMTVTLYR